MVAKHYGTQWSECDLYITDLFTLFCVLYTKHVAGWWYWRNFTESWKAAVHWNQMTYTSNRLTLILPMLLHLTTWWRCWPSRWDSGTHAVFTFCVVKCPHVLRVASFIGAHFTNRCSIPVVIMGETGCGKTRLVRYMCQLQARLKMDPSVPTVEQPQNFFIMKVRFFS